MKTGDLLHLAVHDFLAAITIVSWQQPPDECGVIKFLNADCLNR